MRRYNYIIVLITVVCALLAVGCGSGEPGKTDAGKVGNEDLSSLLFPYKYNKKTVYINRQGKVLLEVPVLYGSEFREGIAFGRKVVNGGLWLFDKTGKFFLETKYINIYPFSNGLAGVPLDKPDPDKPGKTKLFWGFMDKTGNVVIDKNFKYLYSFREGLAAVKEDKLYGFIDKTGKYAIEPKFTGAKYFSEGLACVEFNDKYGYIDRTGKFVIEPKFDWAFEFGGGLAPARLEKNGKFGYIDKTGKFVIEPKFWLVFSFHDGLARFRNSNKEKWGYIDRDGAVAIEQRFEDSEDFYGGLAQVTINGQYEYIDVKGNVIQVQVAHEDVTGYWKVKDEYVIGGKRQGLTNDYELSKDFKVYRGATVVGFYTVRGKIVAITLENHPNYPEGSKIELTGEVFSPVSLEGEAKLKAKGLFLPIKGKWSASKITR